jgi:hypothetical protein
LKKATLRAGVPVVAIVALGVAVAGGSATAGTQKAEDAAVVKMEKQGRELFFTYPKTVEQGRNLKIKNNSDPRKVGPHTFSLVQRSTFPRTNDEIKDCARKFKKICGAIVKWHQVDLQTGQIGRNPAEAGKNGWDEQGNLKHRGDSWVSEREGQVFKEKVKADVGKTLHFICAVHPEMQGKIRVVEG